MEYMTPKEASALWNITERRIQLLCTQNRISGVVKFGRVWAIPRNAQKPMDMRKKQSKDRGESIGRCI